METEDLTSTTICEMLVPFTRIEAAGVEVGAADEVVGAAVEEVGAADEEVGAADEEVGAGVVALELFD
jgi:hypothetical protein